jgi:glyoxylase I family protein
MIDIQAIDHIVLRVVDLEKMIDFYCRVLGCTLEWRRPELGLVHLRAGTAMIDLINIDGPAGSKGGAAPGKEGRNLDHACLRVKGFDGEAIAKHLDSLGVKHGKAERRFGAEGYGESLYLDDPEGNVIELKGALPPGQKPISPAEEKKAKQA